MRNRAASVKSAQSHRLATVRAALTIPSVLTSKGSPSNRRASTGNAPQAESHQ